MKGKPKMIYPEGISTRELKLAYESKVAELDTLKKEKAKLIEWLKSLGKNAMIKNEVLLKHLGVEEV